MTKKNAFVIIKYGVAVALILSSHLLLRGCVKQAVETKLNDRLIARVVHEKQIRAAVE